MFTVYGYSNSGYSTEGFEYESAEDAVRKASILTSFMDEVIITDEEDYCNFHWKEGKVLYPTREDIEDCNDMKMSMA